MSDCSLSFRILECFTANGTLTDVIVSLIGVVASQAERDHFYYTRKQTHSRVLRSCSGEMQREVHAVLGPVGVDEKISRQVADSLLALEDEQVKPAVAATAGGERVSSWLAPGSWSFGKSSTKGAREDNESGLRWCQDVGLTAFLLRFGEGMGKCVFWYGEEILSPLTVLERTEEVPTARLYISAFTIGMG